MKGYIAAICLFWIAISEPRLGCLSNSQELKERFDTKILHPVSCGCDCTLNRARGKYANRQNKCLECGHYHDPRPLIFVHKIIDQKKERSSIENSQVALQQLIDKFRLQRHKQ